MFQPWHFLAFANIITGSIAALYIRVMMKHDDNDPILFSIVFQFTQTALVFIFAYFRGFVFPPLVEMWPQFLLSAVLYSMGSLCNFFASKQIGAGEMTILTSVGAIITIILGVTLLHNPFGLGNMIGTVLILSSVFVLYGKERMKMNSGVWYALGLAVFFGTAVVNDIGIIRRYDAVSYVVVMSFMVGALTSFVYPKHLMKIKKLLQPKPFQHLLLYSFFSAFATVSFYIASSSGATVSQLSPMSRASIIVTVILGAIFLGERKDLGRKIVSAILVSMGVILLG